MSECRTSAHLIHHIFSNKFAMFIHRCALGIGDDEGNKGSPEEAEGVTRKSLSHTETFKAMNNDKKIIEKCKEISTIVSQQMISAGLQARTLTLRLKDVKYNEITRSKTTKSWLQQDADIFKVSLELLKKELPLNLRLLGICMSSFKDAADPFSPANKSMNIKTAFARAQANKDVGPVSSPSIICDENSNIYDFNIEAFDDANEFVDKPGEIVDSTQNFPAPTLAAVISSYMCPVCSDFMADSIFNLNRHLDACLSKSLIGNRKKRKGSNDTSSAGIDRFMKKIN